jgi:acyl-coenzyme A thioesterase 13
MTAIPAGFEPIDFKMPFIDVNGPVYHRVDAPVLHLGLRIEERHCNSLGTVHGGLLATLADISLARALVWKREEKRAFTLNLNLDYIDTASVGAWLEAHVTIKRDSGSIAFATSEIREGNKLILMASGVFKFITPRNG